MKRKEFWDTRDFHVFLFDRRSMPFTWGANDCALFAADAVEAITGVDIAADFRGKYTDEKSAFALIASVTGGATVADAAAYCAEKFGMLELVHPLMAQRGDLVVIEDAGNLIAGVVDLHGGRIAAVGEKGLMLRPITDVKRAWRV